MFNSYLSIIYWVHVLKVILIKILWTAFFWCYENYHKIYHHVTSFYNFIYNILNEKWTHK